jgi:hypothetical protein
MVAVNGKKTNKKKAEIIKNIGLVISVIKVGEKNFTH